MDDELAREKDPCGDRRPEADALRRRARRLTLATTLFYMRERVTTVSCPGEVVDVVLTEHGIAVNPRRPDLADRARNAGLPLVDLARLMHNVHVITGAPVEPAFADRVVALVEWCDGTILDVLRQVAAPAPVLQT